jgi:hypothetical protein
MRITLWGALEPGLGLMLEIQPSRVSRRSANGLTRSARAFSCSSLSKRSPEGFSKGFGDVSEFSRIVYFEPVRNIRDRSGLTNLGTRRIRLK